LVGVNHPKAVFRIIVFSREELVVLKVGLKYEA